MRVGELPAPLAERARAFARGDLAPVAPRDAATVVLVRDAAEGLETYLLRRTPSMAFAAGMYVFPGGCVDPQDHDAASWTGPDPADWAAVLDATPEQARALACAAVRETFEESGVVLAGPDVGDTSSAGWEADRQRLLARETSFGALLQRRALRLRADLLAPWAHWLTPEFEERRFDTRFFVAALPPEQRTRDVGGEADAVRWVSPGDAVAAYERGEVAMLPPTVVTLRELSSYARVGEVLAAAPRRRIARILPRAVVTGDEVRLIRPGDEGYDE